jgi:hypothetical protein
MGGRSLGVRLDQGSDESAAKRAAPDLSAAYGMGGAMPGTCLVVAGWRVAQLCHAPWKWAHAQPQYGLNQDLVSLKPRRVALYGD